MIKLLALVFSFNVFSIIPGVHSPLNNNQILKIQFKRFGISKGGICTATAITQNKILTAAHCVKAYLKSRPSFLRLAINSKAYSILSIDVMPNYLSLQEKYDLAISNKKPFANELKTLSKIDVAVITLNKKLKENIQVTSVAFNIKKSDESKLCGYGYSEYLEGKYLGNKSKRLLCATNSYQTQTGYLFIKGNLLSKNINAALTAPGDSGSPLFNTSGDQIGVLSGITKNDSSDATSYYAMLMSLETFLKNHL